MKHAITRLSQRQPEHFVIKTTRNKEKKWWQFWKPEFTRKTYRLVVRGTSAWIGKEITK